MAEAVEIVDVGPRDGLQSQPTLVSTEAKLEFITRLVDAGIRRLEVASFVNPKRVPQMADADAVIAGLPVRQGVRYIGLVLNRRGFDRALETGIGEINCVVIPSDTFAMKNQGTTAEGLVEFVREIVPEARANGLRCGVTISAAFACPFEGEVPRGRVIELARTLADMGVDEIAIADTIGMAGPSDVKRLVGEVLPVIGALPLRCHFHDTRNTGVANAFAAVEMGVRIIDASCGGVGGCPFAPAATGNVATEDVLYTLERAGFTTGVDIDRLIETTAWLGGVLDAPMPSMVARAGLFAPRGA